MSHYSLDRKRAAVDVFRYVKRLKNSRGVPCPPPEVMASVAAGGASRRQVFRWLHEDLSAEAQELRPERRGSSPLLSQDQVSLLVGFACDLRSSQEPVKLKTLRQFCSSHLSATPTLPTLSRIMAEHGFSSQVIVSRNSRMVDPSVVEDALSAIEEIRSYGFSPDQLLFMDETGLWSNVAAPRTYHFQGWYAINFPSLLWTFFHSVLFLVTTCGPCLSIF